MLFRCNSSVSTQFETKRSSHSSAITLGEKLICNKSPRLRALLSNAFESLGRVSFSKLSFLYPNPCSFPIDTREREKNQTNEKTQESRSQQLSQPARTHAPALVDWIETVVSVCVCLFNSLPACRVCFKSSSRLGELGVTARRTHLLGSCLQLQLLLCCRCEERSLHVTTLRETQPSNHTSESDVDQFTFFAIYNSHTHTHISRDCLSASFWQLSILGR